MPGHRNPSAAGALHRTPTTQKAAMHHATSDPAGTSADGGGFASNSFHQSLYGLDADGGTLANHSGSVDELSDADAAFTAEGGTRDRTPTLGQGGDLGKAKYDFGRLGSMVRFQELTGQLLGRLVGLPGNTLQVEIGGEVSIEGLIFGVKLEAHASRDEDAFEIGGRIEYSIGIGEVGDSGKLTGFVGMDASGDDATEAANLMGLGLEQTIREKQFHREDLFDADFWAGVGKDVALSSTSGVYALFAVSTRIAGDQIADLLWGAGFSAYVVEKMDDDDEVSRGFGGGMEGELEGLHAEVGYEHRDIIGAKNGELDKHGEDDLKIEAGYKHASPPFKFDAKLAAVFPLDNDRGAKATAKVSVENEESVGSAVDAGLLVRNGVIDTLRGLFAQGDGIDQGWVGKLLDGVLRAMTAAAGVVTGSSDLVYSLSIDSTGKVTFKITSKTTYGKDIDLKEKVAGLKFEASLERTVFETDFDTGPLKKAESLHGTTARAGT